MKNNYWIKTLECYSNPKMEYLVPNGKDRTLAKASSIGFSQEYPESAWKQVTSYDWRNLGGNVLEQGRAIWRRGRRAKLGPDQVGPPVPFTTERFIQRQSDAAVDLLAGN